MRFRKSKKFGGLRINLSKSGLGASFGVPGTRVGISSTGKTYKSYGIPGTGIYDLKYNSNNSNNNDDDNDDIFDDDNVKTKSKSKSAEIDDEDSYYRINFSDDLLAIKRMLSELNTANPVLGCTLVFVGLLLLIINFVLFFIVFGIIGLIYYVKLISGDFENKNIAKNMLEALQNNCFNQVLEYVEKLNKISDYNKGVIKRYCYYKKRKYEKVYEILKQYNYNSDKLKLIFICEKLEKYQEMIDIIQALPEDLKHRADIITVLGKCYYNLEKYDLALEVLVNTEGTPIKKRKMNNIVANFRYVLANVYVKLSDNKKAKAQYNKIFGYNEKFLDVKEKLEELEDEEKN